MITALMADTIERVRENYVYDAILLAWVPMSQPTGAGGTASAFHAAFPADGTAVGFLDSAGATMVPVQLTAAGKVP
ncbi:MAG: hypothetical protein LUO93_02460, partial [Methanomicrobiales archaeon]|nr:hypothetical protein [Methanomicrobiales archaeon]